MIAQGKVDPASFESGHWLELDHLAGLFDASGRAVCEITELPLAPSAVILHVDADASPFAHPPRQHQVDEMLEGGQALALATDERAEGFSTIGVGDDVQAARIAGLDLDLDREADMAHQLFEDLLARGQCLGGRLGSLEIGPLGGKGPPRGLDLGGFGRAQRRCGSGTFTGRTIGPVAARSAILAAWSALPVGATIRPLRACRRRDAGCRSGVALGRRAFACSGSGAAIAERAVIPAWT